MDVFSNVPRAHGSKRFSMNSRSTSDWIQPETFIADGGAYMTFVSRNESIFNATCIALKYLGDRS
jgi:hypothetical protein